MDNSGKMSVVEMCSCPIGYAGLSCETCDWGFVEVQVNSTTDHRKGGHKCVKCDCNGHSGSCDLIMGQCNVSLTNFLIDYEFNYLELSSVR